MDDNFKKIETKIDKLDERLDQVDKHLAVYNQQLIYHIARTDALEAKLEPVESHVTLMNNIVKILIFIGILAAIYKNLR